MKGSINKNFADRTMPVAEVSHRVWISEFTISNTIKRKLTCKY